MIDLHLKLNFYRWLTFKTWELFVLNNHKGYMPLGLHICDNVYLILLIYNRPLYLNFKEYTYINCGTCILLVQNC